MTSETGRPVKKHFLLFAQHDPAHCLAPALFRSLSARSRDSQKLRVTYDFNQATQLVFEGDEQLGPDDLRTLQGLVALGTLSAKQSDYAPTATPTDIRRELQKRLISKSAGTSAEVQFLRTSYPLLARELGYSSVNGGSTYAKLASSVARLSAVRLTLHTLEADSWVERSSQLIAQFESESAGRELFIALNPRLTTAVRSTKGKQYFRVSLDEARRLKSDASRLLHQRLHFINAGSQKRIELDTLAGYVWATPSENINTQKSRVRTLQKALSELAAIGWSVTSPSAGLYEIARPASTLPKSRPRVAESEVECVI